jgi:hypothetical protein
MTDQTHVEEEYEEVPLGRYIAIAAVVAVVVAAGAFFAGKAAAGSSGPSTLAAAVSQARAGKLPCGATASASPSAGAAGARPNADFLVAAVCDRSAGTGFRRSGTGTGAGGFGGGAGFGGPGGAAGTIQSVDGSTLTIQGRQGTQKVTLGSGTTVRKYATGSKADLKTGASVIVSGGQNGAPRTVTVLPAGQGGQ